MLLHGPSLNVADGFGPDHRWCLRTAPPVVPRLSTVAAHSPRRGAWRDVSRCGMTSHGDSLPAPLAAFMRAFAPLVALNAHVRLAPIPGAGWGLRAVEALPAHSLVARIPRAFLLGTHTLAASPLGCLLPSLTDHAPEALAIFLVCERFALRTPALAPYVAALPHAHTSLVGATLTTLARFCDARLSERAVRMLRQRRQAFSTLCEKLSAYDEVLPLELRRPSWRTWLTWEHYSWGCEMVQSRALYITAPLDGNALFRDDHSILAPLADFLNHSDHAQTRGGYNTASMCYEITTLLPVDAGDEVCLAYGPHDNSELLLTYGFAIPDNIFERVPLEVSALAALACNVEAKLAKLGLDLAKTQWYVGHDVGDGGVPWHVYTLARLLAMVPTEEHLWERVLNDEPISPEAEQRARHLLRRIIEAALCTLTSTSEGDDSLATVYVATRQRLLEKVLGTLT